MDEDDQGVALDLLFFRSNISVGAENGAYSIDDAGSRDLLGWVRVVAGDFTDWGKADVEYRDTIGDTIHRDYPGYGGLHYRNDSGRNDLVTCKVAVDPQPEMVYLT